MTAWAWFLFAGVAICGMIARYCFYVGDVPWGVMAVVVGVISGLFAIYEVGRSP